jgi:prevent-host-death family protein
VHDHVYDGGITVQARRRLNAGSAARLAPPVGGADLGVGDLADVINAAATRDQVTFVTSRGRRVACVVSVAAAEQAAGPDGQADDDAGTAVMFAVNLAMLEDRGGTPSLTPADLFEQYANDLVRELGGSADRALSAARAVIAGSPGKAGCPMLWRQAALAVELCQRAAEITGPELPGSYRPGSRAPGGARW